MLGLERFFNRATENISVQPVQSQIEARVFIQHQRSRSTHMVSRFFLLQDLESQHRQRIVDELEDIDEIVREGGHTPGVQLRRKHFAVHWLLPEDPFEQVCRQVEIEEDVLDVLRDILGWHQRPDITHFSENLEEARREKRQAEQETGVTWYLW